ncbi:MAG: hypothetical protein AB8B44_05690 [Prochlorococcus sp.]
MLIRGDDTLSEIPTDELTTAKPLTQKGIKGLLGTAGKTFAV